MRKSVSIILPTYNERENLKIIIPAIEELFDKNLEIVVVDDNSADGTREVARELNSKFKNIRLIERDKKEGIGSAIRCGYNCAANDVLISMDADLSFDVNDILRLYNKILDGYDLVLGTRHTKESFYGTPNLKIKIKYFISTFGNKFLSFVSGAQFSDFTANFRAIKKEVWRSIRTDENTNFFLPELIFEARRHNYKITEIPVSFRDRIHGQSKINYFIEAPKAFLKLTKYYLWRN